ncbi:autotransporter domain-containing protein [Bradyrhizobium sp. CCGUVB23]|uniref:autotransporter outer membrane beta-barrel domain-containing protein n=1 Tax=Bradyrhizobium sp. CCGUVB23 TaxID=2949630 RepID=UPI0020B1DCF7|nr:autotransporter domain-containing protein [Bradyrhizobium sp. CCGUVB23]MCP3466142.1 autotransporter domain-containing protein [Bradyrhizobium sp. CCGUVB23]
MISTGRARKPAHPFSRFIPGSPRPRSMKRSHALSLLLASTALTALIAAQPAEAGTPVWTGTNSSDWYDTGNWNPNTALPNSGDIVTIDTGSSKPADIVGGVATAANIIVGKTSNGANSILTVNGASLTSTGITVGSLTSATLSLFNAGSVQTGTTTVGLGSGGRGVINIGDPGTSWVNSGAMYVGYFGQGTVNVSGGGSLTSDTIDLGVQSTSFALNTLSVAGSGSSAQINNGLVVGDAGTGQLSVVNGGSVTVGSSAGIVVASQAGSFGTVFISLPGSTLTAQSLTVGASGSASLYLSGGSLSINNGTGDITLAQNAGSFGTLIIGNDIGSPASAPGTINAATMTMGAGTAELDFNHTGTNYVFSPAISGSGTIQHGGGVTTLTGDSSGFTGTTNVSGGTLLVNGTLGGTTTVNGGTLGGFGTVGDTTVNSGTLAPGNSISSIGTLTVQGNLVLSAAATYLVQVSPTSANLTNVTGTADLGGATVNAVFAAGSYVTKQYTIVHAAGGVSGTFATLVNTNLPSGFTSSLSQDATNAYLNLTLNFALPSTSGLNVNQQNVATSITNFFNAGGSVPIAFGGLTPAGLTQLSGEVATGSQQATFNAMGLFLGLLTDPVARGDGGVAAAPVATGYADEAGDAARRRTGDAFAMALNPTSRALYEPRWSVWTSAFGGSQSTDGRATIGSNDTTSRIFGGAVGADYLFSPNTYAGFALAGGGTNFSVTGSGYGRSDLFQAGAYVRHTNGPAYVTAALAYGWQDITTDRTVTVAGIDRLQANFKANAYSGRVEGGYRVIAPWTGGIGITPYAAAQVTMFDLPGYAETVLVGTGTSALTYAAKSVTDARSELGVRMDKSFAAQDGVLTLRSRFAWAHDFNPDRSVAATFQALPGASFVVNGAAQATDAALVTAAAEKKWLNGWAAAATFEGEFSNVTRSYAGKGVVRYQW